MKQTKNRENVYRTQGGHSFFEIAFKNCKT